MKKNRQIKFSILAAIVIFGSFATWTNASTINGIANQIISGFAAHNVLVGGGTNDPVTVAPSATIGFPLISQGSSADPLFGQVPNAGLVNSSITFASAGCITATGAVSLGGTFTLTNSCTGFNGVTSAAPGATPTWTLQNGDIAWTLNASATVTVSIVTADKWVPHSVQICQPAVGGPFTFSWPANVKGGMTIGTTANKCNMQTFETYDGTNLFATGTGVLNQ